MPTKKPPIYTKEGPKYYTSAYEHNKDFAVPGPYITTLSADDEDAFREWVDTNNVPYDPNATTVDYDMRGYWQDTIKPGGTWTQGDHFPDTWKTPYDTSFSDESQYATVDNPFHWQGDVLVDTRDGSVVFDSTYKPDKKPPAPETTARQALERSRLDPKEKQREMMGDDIDLEKLLIYFKSVIKFDAIERVTDIVVERTIEGASTVEVTLNDHDRGILRSGVLHSGLDIEISGLWFRLVKIEKQDDSLILTFEDREVSILRTYDKPKFAYRKNVTRAEFILSLIREVKEFKIPVVIPELHVQQPVEVQKGATFGGGSPGAGGAVASSRGVPPSAGGDGTAGIGGEAGGTAGGAGIGQGAGLTVQGARATPAQIAVANAIMAEAESMGIGQGSSPGTRRKVLVMAMTAAIEESGLDPSATGDGGLAHGVFQQHPGWGGLSDDERRDPRASAHAFLLEAQKVDRADPDASYTSAIHQVQDNADPNAYAPFVDEGNAFVSAYGIPGGAYSVSPTTANNSQPAGKPSPGTIPTDPGKWMPNVRGLIGDPAYFFYRGDPQDNGTGTTVFLPEDSWTCIQRLADEVNWRAYFISGIFYYLSEDLLFSTQPIMTVQEFSKGIEGIDADYDTGKKSAEITLNARIGLWVAPPGSVVVLQAMGPWNGRWLVNTFRRSLFDSRAEIVLKKPRPKLPEPFDEGVQNPNGQPTWSSPGDPTDPAGVPNDPHVTPRGGLGCTAGDLSNASSEFHNPDGSEGMPGPDGRYYHGAFDWMLGPDMGVPALETGTVIEANPSTSNSTQVFGGTVKIRTPDGRVLVYRHVNPSPLIHVGDHVTRGDQVATVTRWNDNPGSSHAHVELWNTESGGYNLSNATDPLPLIQSWKCGFGKKDSQQLPTLDRA